MSDILQWIGYSSILFTVLALASISGMLSEKVGIINIGINGMMIIGALVFSILGRITNNQNNPWYYQILALIIATLITGIFALLHAFATVTLKADHIVSGMAINILASGIGLFFASIPDFSMNNSIHSGFNIISIDKTGIFNLYIFIALIFIVLLIFFLNFTRKGMSYKAIGENPYAAHALGINVVKWKYIAIVVSGLIAGFAGAVFTLYNTSIFTGNVSGTGYTALAIMICGQWRTEFIIIVAFVFSLLTGASNIIWDNDVYKNSQNLFRTLPYIFTIILMVAISKWSKVPKALGQPFILDSKI